MYLCIYCRGGVGSPLASPLRLAFASVSALLGSGWARGLFQEKLEPKISRPSSQAFGHPFSQARSQSSSHSSSHPLIQPAIHTASPAIHPIQHTIQSSIQPSRPMISHVIVLRLLSYLHRNTIFPYILVVSMP